MASAQELFNSIGRAVVGVTLVFGIVIQASRRKVRRHGGLVYMDGGRLRFLLAWIGASPNAEDAHPHQGMYISAVRGRPRDAT